MGQNYVKRDSKLFYFLLLSDISLLKQNLSISSDKWKKMMQKLQIISQPFSFPGVWFVLGAFPSHLILLLPKRCLQLFWFCLLLEVQALGGEIYFFPDADILGIWLCYGCQVDPVLWLKKKKEARGLSYPMERWKFKS